MKSNYQDFQRYPEVDIAIAADAQATLPSLIEACKRLITADRRRALDERGKTDRGRQRSRASSGRAPTRLYAWDASPISTARVCGGDVGRGQEQGLGARRRRRGSRLWNIDKFYQTLGGGGAAAVGSGLPTAVGAALAHKKHGRLCIGLQNDGDMMYAPGALWTAAHHRIPLLLVMHNNRAYHQEVMHIQRMANRRQRGITNAGIGTTIEDPNIDYATLARSMGVYGGRTDHGSEGPGPGPQARRRARRARRNRARRRRHATAIGEKPGGRRAECAHRRVAARVGHHRADTCAVSHGRRPQG